MQNLSKSTQRLDILNCIANVSNDEVFTSPHIVNKMLDLLPQELFTNKNSKFLDPACKTGVFLREITKRLINGLEKDFPDLKTRIDYILKNMVYGMAITELTFLMTKRTLYCAKDTSSKYSVVNFEDPNKTNIIYKNIEHTFKNGSCIYCNGSEKSLALKKFIDETDKYSNSTNENYAYQFIHDLGEFKNMKFDVIIGNPPYQLSDGGNGASAKPLYHKFVEQAIKMNPRYITMIIPSRWFSGGKGLDEFRSNMLNDNRIRVIHDFPDCKDCFPDVEIKAGVNYFLWDRDHRGNCEVNTHKGGEITSKATRQLLEAEQEIFIRYNEAISILHKVKAKNQKTMDELVSSRKPFGFATNFEDFKLKPSCAVGSSFLCGVGSPDRGVGSPDRGVGSPLCCGVGSPDPIPDASSTINLIKLYYNGWSDKGIGYVDKNLIKINQNLIDKYKVLLPKAIGEGGFDDILKTIIAEPNSCCTETYIIIGSFDTEKEALNLKSYIETKFFRFLVSLIKNTQDNTKKVYAFVPIQNFNEEWSDGKLYEKYGLDEEEIGFIERVIRGME